MYNMHFVTIAANFVGGGRKRNVKAKGAVSCLAGQMQSDTTFRLQD